MSNGAVNEQLFSLYDEYYIGDDELEKKRALAAKDSVDHIQAIWRKPLGKCVDIGSGNGSVINELVDRELTDNITALEISASGIESISARQLAAVRNVVQFDGYKIPFADKAFDTAICIHVLEHVEHERLLLREMARVAEEIFIEIPLEGGFRGRTNYRFGHINYYSPLTARSILETSGLKVVSAKVVTSSKAYEQFCYGGLGGALRAAMRRTLLKIMGNRAAHLMTFLYVAHCRSATSPEE